VHQPLGFLDPQLARRHGIATDQGFERAAVKTFPEERQNVVGAPRVVWLILRRMNAVSCRQRCAGEVDGGDAAIGKNRFGMCFLPVGQAGCFLRSCAVVMGQDTEKVALCR